ncbi:uncharacterized protein LOC108595511 [Drosophila busckii]|uniref:uncharacterized protein LOC108595511 n=1 Tax=Drosophila busckii TaxID=30019 RepID=UPI00083EB20C|nr:uncharacterized protein LOC108595511 [Drosophila busckii]
MQSNMAIFVDKKTMMVNSRRLTDYEKSERSSTYHCDELEGEECTDSRTSFTTQLSRTTLMLLDYAQFKAARTIQANWRCFYARRSFRKRVGAAITIQRWWRGFRVRQTYFNFVEQKLQRKLLSYYDACATKIQALFRGWWIRSTVHDMYSLRQMQVCAAADLLNCVAYKLHHLLRTYSIPGVYSLRNSNCLSRVEKLLASMNFRFHNGRVRSSMTIRQATIEYHRNTFKKSQQYTSVPFAGPNFKGICQPQCEEMLFRYKDMDRRMYKIMAEYEESQRDNRMRNVQMSYINKRRRRKLENRIKQHELKKRDFCGDVIASMRRWKIWDDNKLTIPNDIFRNPENLDAFVNEIEEIFSEINGGQCHCRIPVHDEVICH